MHGLTKMEAQNIGEKYVATESIQIDDIFDDEDNIMSIFDLKEVWECQECYEHYFDENEAEECCGD